MLIPVIVIGASLATGDAQTTAAAKILLLFSATAFASLILVVLTRFGLFALLVAINFSYWNADVLTTNTVSWIFPSSVMTIAVYAAIAIYGFWTSLGEQRLFKDAI
jgi:hypothetical protein